MRPFTRVELDDRSGHGLARKRLEHVAGIRRRVPGHRVVVVRPVARVLGLAEVHGRRGVGVVDRPVPDRGVLVVLRDALRRQLRADPGVQVGRRDRRAVGHRAPDQACRGHRVRQRRAIRQGGEAGLVACRRRARSPTCRRRSARRCGSGRGTRRRPAARRRRRPRSRGCRTHRGPWPGSRGASRATAASSGDLSRPVFW